jgi:hypothetical protein
MELVKEDFEKKTGVHLIIDYFSATFPFICYEDDSDYKIIDEVILMCCESSILKEVMLKCVILMSIGFSINISYRIILF